MAYAFAWVLGASLLLGCAGAEAPASGDHASAPSYVPGEYIVRVLPPAGAAALRATYGPLGITKLVELGGGQYLIRLERDPGIEALRKASHASAHIAAVEPNFVYRYQQ